MIVELYVDAAGYKIVASNVFDEKEEYISTPGDGIYEYVAAKGRLNASYIVYCLTAMKKRTKAQQTFLDFLNKANDHRHPKRVTRPPGWRNTAGLGTPGEAAPFRPAKPGDVVVYGDVARATLQILGD
jgi:hypothetical protein